MDVCCGWLESFGLLLVVAYILISAIYILIEQHPFRDLPGYLPRYLYTALSTISALIQRQWFTADDVT